MCRTDAEKYFPHTISLRLLLAGIFVTSFCLLAFEIVLTRMLSVVFSYHFVFGVISLALTGHGFGAIYVLMRKKRESDCISFIKTITFYAGVCAFSIALSAVAVIRLGYSASGLLFFLAILFIPFFWGGAFFAEVFTVFSSHSFWVYGADLVGAGMGCAAIVFLLKLFSGPQAVFVIALTGLSGAVMLALSSTKNTPFAEKIEGLKKIFNPKSLSVHIANGLFIILMLICSFSFDMLKRIPAGLSRDKEIHEALKEGQIEESRWSAFGQTDLVGYQNFPERKDIYIDGTAGTPMYHFNGDVGNPNSSVARLKQDFPGYFPFRFLNEEEKDNALIIGPGGGRDILLALMGGIKQIEAVEVNRDFIDIVKAHSRYNGGIYTAFENVRITIDEGRSFLKRQMQKYDLIMLSLPATNSSRSREGFSLTENFLLTTDAIEDYLKHLSPEGRLLVVTHGEVEALRLLSITLAALEREGIGVKEAMKRIYLVGDEQYPVFVLQQRPIAPELVPAMYHMMIRQGYSPSSSYFPYVDRYGSVNTVLLDLASNRKTTIETYRRAMHLGYDVYPVTDNSPFFFKFEPGLPRPVKWVLWLSVVILIMTSLSLLQATLKRNRRSKPQNSESNHYTGSIMRYFFLFFILGTGFMIVEISMTQKCFLFLGHPVLSIAVMLFSILAGAGMGGLASRIVVSERMHRALAFSLLAVAVILFGYTAIVPILFNALIGFSLGIRMLVAVFLLTALGVAMGFPFPLALRMLNDKRSRFIPWMLGINGLSAVFGSALSVAVAIKAGIIQALWIGALLYFVGSCLFFWAKGENK